jgi:phage terminase small subunit
VLYQASPGVEFEIISLSQYPQQSPYLSVANKQFEIMMKIATEFGFMPASRTRIFTYSQKNSMLLDAVEEIDDGTVKW